MPCFSSLLKLKSNSPSESPSKGVKNNNPTKHTLRKFLISSKMSTNSVCKNASKIWKNDIKYKGRSPPSPQFPPPPSSSSDDLTLFLQYKTNVRKFLLNGGYSNLSKARLYLAFVETFTLNHNQNGNGIPEMYMKEPVSGNMYKLVDMHKIKDRSIIILKDEALNIKGKKDDGLSEISNLIKDINSIVDEQQDHTQNIGNCQQDTRKEISEILNITASLYRTIDQEAMESYRTPGPSSIKTLVSDVKNDLGRENLEEKKNGINQVFKKLVDNVDELLNAVNELHEDVTVRGLEPHPRKLQTVSKDLALADVKLKKIKAVVNDEIPIWNNTWDEEIERIRDDRGFMSIYKSLVEDLEADISKSSCLLTHV